ncbi:MAG: NAD(+) diphosphatase [Cyanobacteria bacterium Co-bin8]|nr:NAD(+) diphosphatase [Cyanobacteria bacterium Co-bin8]
MSELFMPGVTPPGENVGSAWWFAFSGNRLLVHEKESQIAIPQLPNLEAIGLNPLRTQFLGWLGNQPCLSAELPQQMTPPADMALRGLRELYAALDETLFSLAGLGFQVMEWDRTHQFCGACGQPTESANHERAKRCSGCRITYYPRVSPAMIVLISRGDEILLGRAPRFKPGMYGLIAGYVEPGESLEAAVVREVKEEVGITIKDLRYWGSQPWPFPHTLMVGYTATYAEGDIVIDKQELADAAWFHKDSLPLLPPHVSIARKMIDWFVETH